MYIKDIFGEKIQNIEDGVIEFSNGLFDIPFFGFLIGWIFLVIYHTVFVIMIIPFGVFKLGEYIIHLIWEKLH